MYTFFVSNQCCHLKAICFSVCAELIKKAAKSVPLTEECFCKAEHTGYFSLGSQAACCHSKRKPLFLA